MTYTVEEITSSKGVREIDYQQLLHSLGVVRGNPFMGALAYTGCKQVAKNGEAYRFAVNGRRGFKWHIYVVLNGSDLYDIVLVQSRGTDAEILAQSEDIYFDELQGMFEALYDAMIKKHNGGFINV